jgi:hyperosmotically inducible periplasmic protein
MNRKWLIAFSMVAFPFLCSCTLIARTTYGVAMDERGAGAIVSDEKIKLTIRERLLQDGAFNPLDISTFCYNGHAYLVGEYRTEEQKNRAVEIARTTPGVKVVTTHLVKGDNAVTCGFTDGLQVTAKIKAALIADPDIRSTNIDEKTVHCHVVLLGIVGSWKEIIKAIDHAKSISGVNVTSYLKVAE